MNDIVWGIALVPLIVGMVQAVKDGGFIESRFSSLFAVALGVAAGFLVKGTTPEALITGIAYGLSASGLYSGVKAVSGG